MVFRKPVRSLHDKEFSPDRLLAILNRCGITADDVQLDRLWLYHQMLREHNTELNLTRIHRFENMVLKLYVDSILPGTLIALPSPLLDLGTGAGMPGIPLKIFFPHLEILLAESRGKRVRFLETVLQRLGLSGVELVPRAVTPQWERPVAGVITRAVESIGKSLERMRGCLIQGGLAIFMKGPGCDEELAAAQADFHGSYRLREDRAYRIPQTPHERRLVVFQRLDEPIAAVRRRAAERHGMKRIESEQNDTFRQLKSLLTSKGIRKEGRAIVCGGKLVEEVLRDFPDRCEAWISRGDRTPPPGEAPESLGWIQLAPALFDVLDRFGTRAPLMLVRVEEPPAWDPSAALPDGCTVFLPFQDPENVGAALRSAVAFGVAQVVLLSQCAHPFHPKALRASGGAAFHARLLRGPSIGELPENVPVIPLSTEGQDIRQFHFPDRFGLLPGLEGPGLPEAWRPRGIRIRISEKVESLNAGAALAVALYAWRSRLESGS